MVLASPGYQAGGDDPLNVPALHVFFGVLETLAKAGVMVVAEAAFQDRLSSPAWNRSPPTPTCGSSALPSIRPWRTSRSPPAPGSTPIAPPTATRSSSTTSPRAVYALDAFADIRLDLPCLTVDTRDGYRPGLEAIIAFLTQLA
ncbi:hypothetical protein Ga0074812_14728 [Parafrankia irregularis]|uniref:Uncharacterized protein n=1 Tax=Parafrankia irregularis TaxID=795642 RepID=A0A0S4R086_9ACTN|nr:MULTISPECIES: hypothetical protein [Parafrankia]CUU60782.1 hypothetical protein Ga0074812_14728 [Parafrankia irregularis]